MTDTSASVAAAGSERSRTAAPYMLMLVFAVGATFRISYLTESFILSLSPFGCFYFLNMHGLSGRWSRSQVASIVLAASAIILYPMFTAGLGRVIGGPQIPLAKFLSSYGLWVANFGMIAAAMTMPVRGNPRTLGQFAFWALVVIASFGVLQSVLANLLGSDLLYNIWGNRNYFDFTYPLSHFFKDGMYRTPSFYYEPSIFGRFCVCLCAVCLITGFKPLMSVAVAMVGAMVSVSAGSIMMLGAVLLIWCVGYSERPKKTRIVVSYIALVTILAAPFLETFVVARFSELDNAAYSSGFVRLLLPLAVISDTLGTAPLGAPVGSNEFLSQSNVLFNRYSGEESKITNGVYEIILYTGYTGFAALLLSSFLFVRSLVRRNWRQATVLFVMTVATIVSSSFLAFESTIQLLPILVAYRLKQKRETA